MYKNLFALCLMYILVACPVAVAAEGRIERTFGASATATKSVPADIVSLSLTVSDESDKEEEAARLASQRGERLVSALAERGFKVGGVQISNVKTSRKRTRVRVRTENGLREQVLIKVGQNLEMTVGGFKKISDVLETVFKEGADNIKKVTLASSKASEIEKELTEEAIKRAIEKARWLAGNVDIELGSVVNLRTRAAKLSPSQTRKRPTLADNTSGTIGQADYGVTATVNFEQIKKN